jgi:predicted DNA-binding ribbon-helix-helix protein
MVNQIKKSLILSGHKTSVALEKEFWEALESIADKNNISTDALIQKIDQNDRNGSLASALRVFILSSFIEMKKQ